MNSDFCLAADVVGDEAVGGAEDRLRAAVILFQPHDVGVGKVLLESQNVANLRAAPAVDRLVRIARRAQIRIIVRQGPHDLILRQVGVLIFVHHDVTIAVIQLGPDFFVLRQQPADVHQKIVEINGVGLEEQLFVHRIYPRHDLIEVIAAPVLRRQREHFRRLQMVLRLTDAVQNAAGFVVLRVRVEVRQDSLDELRLVGGVEDCEVWLQADCGRVAPQQPRSTADEKC